MATDELQDLTQFVKQRAHPKKVQTRKARTTVDSAKYKKQNQADEGPTPAPAGTRQSCRTRTMIVHECH